MSSANCEARGPPTPHRTQRNNALTSSWLPPIKNIIPGALTQSGCREQNAGSDRLETANVTLAAMARLRKGRAHQKLSAIVRWDGFHDQVREGAVVPLFKWLTKLCQHPHRQQIHTEQRLRTCDDPHPANRFE